MEDYLNKIKEGIRAFISQNVDIDDHDWQEFSNRLHYKEYKKGELITKSGEVENHLYCIFEGVVRLFNKFGNTEYTLRFNFPVSFFSAYASYISRAPSYLNIETLTPVKVFAISYEDIESLYLVSKNAEKVGRKMLEYFYLIRELKEIEMHTKTAEENYHNLLKMNPEVIQQVPVKHIASYLGIAPESLSRIRAKIVNSKQ